MPCSDASGRASWRPGTPLIGPSLVHPASRGEVLDARARALQRATRTPAALRPSRRSATPYASSRISSRAGAGAASCSPRPATTTPWPRSTASRPSRSRRRRSTSRACSSTAFGAGVSRTFLYELVDVKPEPALHDPEQHFGLLRNDLSPKPAFTAVKTMIAAIRASPGPRRHGAAALGGRADEAGRGRAAAAAPRATARACSRCGGRCRSGTSRRASRSTPGSRPVDADLRRGRGARRRRLEAERVRRSRSSGSTASAASRSSWRATSSW